MHVSSDWISSKITVTGSISAATAVDIKMYDPSNKAQKSIHVADSATDQNSDDRSNIWYVTVTSLFPNRADRLQGGLVRMNTEP